MLQSLPPPRASFLFRIRVFIGLLAGLRRHDFRSARTWINTMYPGASIFTRLMKFVVWSLDQMWVRIPDSLTMTTFAPAVSKIPFWLKEGNPLENHPWKTQPDAILPERAHVVVIGAGFTGGSLAYHWGKFAPADESLKMIVLDMGDAAGGSSGRNEGLVVMGRYCHMVYKTVIHHFDKARTDLPTADREQLAKQFGIAYTKAAYHNGDLVEETIKAEHFDCDYARAGWVQARDADQQQMLANSVKMAQNTGLSDWTSITPDEVERLTGMHVKHNAGFSIAAASFHPAKWVWSLLKRALASNRVELYSRTKVARIERDGDGYLVKTDRGTIHANYVVNATEAYTPMLHPQFHDRILPTQTQAASGTGGPENIKPHVGISGTRGFFAKHHDAVLIGSDATRVPDNEAGIIQPSRFITKFLLGEMQNYYGPYRYHVTNEWSGTVSYTPDEFPIVGVMDGYRQYIIAGMAGSGTAVSFNGGRCVVNRILGRTDEQDDYPPEYFSPTRLLDPQNHKWPEVLN
ncbi:MAG: FAD-binding oxidoreductase [Planctomycetota bacterium]|nr:FAD-binding oxidoreductase [Planctomycetota bacterium]MDA1215220.1 FAD-binding oxidoreductase [Planctomycetota bacterium]